MDFDLPRDVNSIIKVIGVGGGGSNAVNHMYNQGIIGVDFIVCNTDRQALDISPVPFKIQLGPNLTEGRGAGMIPEVGMNAAIENIEEIRELLSKSTKMVFVTAGMGGGTGTGAAPVIAQVAKDLGILTVGIVTVPFSFEGRKRRQQAEEGLEKMRQNVDTLLVINNEHLREFGKNMSLSDAFSHADNILTVAAKGIAEVISVTGAINVDFNDVNTVLRNSGHAIMGSATAEGENRATEAVKAALTSPLLNDNDIHNARYVLLNITYGNKEVMMDEITEITDYIQDAAGATADVIWGHGFDASLGDKISITLIATGFASSPITGFEKAPERKLISLDEVNSKEITAPLQNPVQQVVSTPTVQEQLAQPPFLKSEPTVENTTLTATVYSTPTPTPVVTPVVEQKTSYDLFETPVNVTPTTEVTTPSASTLNTETPSVENNVTPPTVNPTSYTIEDEVVSPEPKAVYSWDVVDTNETPKTYTEERVTPTPTPQFSTPVSENKDTIIRHILEDDSNDKINIEAAKKVISVEEQQRKNNERVSRIQEYTAKLKKAEGIAEFENEPAYVRRNINLNNSTPSAEESYSRFGLSQDSNGNTTLKGNNFLHDNVD
ncbi:MAG: cell division protein FtsZ [Crocinitomicaceae bacterium]|nr:cell division protein FtsZ [Crocinitomicaceae bacterium]